MPMKSFSSAPLLKSQQACSYVNRMLVKASFLAYSHRDALSAELTKVDGDLTVASNFAGHLAGELKVAQEDLEKEQGKTSTAYTRI
ncbi:hypothetical protein LWI28_027539 [Acer negundo]|uniref:Uncharacterized protein n=1 Tax=Acer negundo TaxID=4023 RepID=A0AAD5P4Y5_ACENE|nr:hypothetical protein LWI28_027539 [Acer negundo]